MWSRTAQRNTFIHLALDGPSHAHHQLSSPDTVKGGNFFKIKIALNTTECAEYLWSKYGPINTRSDAEINEQASTQKNCFFLCLSNILLCHFIMRYLIS